MPTKKENPLSFSISIVLLFALVTIFGAGGLIYYLSKQYEQESCDRYNDRQYEYVKSTAYDLTVLLRSIKKDLEYVATIPDVQQTKGEQILPHLIACFDRFDGGVSDVARIDVDGNIIASYKTELRAVGESVITHPSTFQTLHTKAVSLAGPYDSLMGTKVVSIDIPVFQKDANGQSIFNGTLSCSIDLASWSKTYMAPYDLTLGGYTCIINQDYQIVGHSNQDLLGAFWHNISQAHILNAKALNIKDFHDKPFLAQALASSGGKIEAQLDSFGTETQLIVYAPVHFGTTQWIVLSNASRQAVLQPFQYRMRQVWLVGSCFLGLFVFVALYTLTAEQQKFSVERELRYSLQQSEKRYRLLIERSHDAILLTSSDGFIKLVNKRFTEMIGKSEEELLGKNICEYILPDQRLMMEEQWESRERGISASYEIELINSKHESIIVIYSESPVFNRKNEHIGNLAILTDITNKKQAEEAIKRQNRELYAINSIAETVSKSLVLEEIFSATVQKVCETVSTEICMVFAIDEKIQQLILRASYGVSPGFASIPEVKSIPLYQGYSGKAVKTKSLVVVNNLSAPNDNLATRPGLAAIQAEGIVSAVFIPINGQETCYGLIACGNRNIRNFTDNDIRLLTTIGQTIGMAVEKALLYQNARRRFMRLETIYRVGDRLNALLELDQLLPSVVKLIHETFSYYNVNVFLYDKSTEELIFTAGYGGFQLPEPIGVHMSLSQGIVGRCFQKCLPQLVNDVTKDPDYMFVDNLAETKAELSVPLLVRGVAIGVLDVQGSHINAFDEEDTLTLQTLAEQIAISVENAQLYEKIKHSLDEVRKSQAFFAKIVLESPLATFIINETGTCILMNSTAILLIGSNVSDAVGEYNLLTDAPFAGTEVANRLHMALAGQVTRFTVDLPTTNTNIVKPGYEVLSLRATLFPLMDDNNRVANVVAKFEDLTEKKQLEEALQHAQKMESIGTLAGGIAHDFNNILGGVLGYTSFIKTKMDKGDPIYRYINIIESSARRAADLTQQLLAFARGGKYQVETLNLNRIINEAVDLIARSISKNIVITMDLSPEVPVIEGDSNQIVQTIVNMCINARDALPNGGEINISTRIKNLADALLYRYPNAQQGTYVLLKVRDNGIGMSEETQKRIFEPFFTTKKDQNGTGLGLAMVYGIVQNHGGYIDVSSEIGKGTTFYIYLPFSNKVLNEVETVQTEPESGNETILVAEDEYMMRELLVEMLDSGGYKVITAPNGHQAIDIYQEQGHQIDLVILDMMMPGINGQETFRQLKKINPAVKVLLSSGYSEDVQEISNERGLGFIQKPYGVNELLDKVRSVIDSQ